MFSKLSLGTSKWSFLVPVIFRSERIFKTQENKRITVSMNPFHPHAFNRSMLIKKDPEATLNQPIILPTYRLTDLAEVDMCCISTSEIKRAPISRE